MNLKTSCCMKEARHKGLHIVWFHLYEMSQVGKSIEIESKLAIARNWGEEMWGMTANRHWVSFGDDENTQELDSGDGCTS